MIDTSMNPGGDAAIAAGCTCPCLDNAHGQGWMGQGGRFWVRLDCPLHGEHKSQSYTHNSKDVA